MEDGDWAEVPIRKDSARDATRKGRDGGGDGGGGGSGRHHGDDGADDHIADHGIHDDGEYADEQGVRTCENYHKSIHLSEDGGQNSNADAANMHATDTRATATPKHPQTMASEKLNEEVLQSAVAIAASLAPWASKAVTRALGKPKKSSSSISIPTTKSNPVTVTAAAFATTTGTASTSSQNATQDTSNHRPFIARDADVHRNDSEQHLTQTAVFDGTTVSVSTDRGAGEGPQQHAQSGQLSRSDSEDEMDEIALRRQLGRQMRDSEHVSPEMVEEVRTSERGVCCAGLGFWHAC